MSRRPQDRSGKLFARFNSIQDTELIAEVYNQARKEYQRLVNRILIINGQRPHLYSTPYSFNLDLTGIDIQKQVTTSLSLTDVGIVKIPGWIFEDYSYLTTLDFSNNHIQHLGPEFGNYLHGLVQLNLSHNELNTFSLINLRSLSSLRFLNLSNNPLDHEWKRKLFAYARIVNPQLSILS